MKQLIDPHFHHLELSDRIKILGVPFKVDQVDRFSSTKEIFDPIRISLLEPIEIDLRLDDLDFFRQASQ